MRRQRRDLGVGLDLEHDGPVGGERLLPRGAHPVAVVAEDPFEAAELGVGGVVEVGQPLRARELRVALHHALLPRDLVQVVVVEDADDEPLVGQRSM